MAVNITLTSSMRSNLSSLKSLASQMSTTQVRLSTGKKVNSAIDNANSYYQSRALTNRASDLDMLLDAMGQSIQTVTAAVHGLEKSAEMLENAAVIAQNAYEAAIIPEKAWFEAQVGPNGAVVTSAQELRDAINANKEMICVYGKIDYFENETLTMKANQKLVGTEYFTGYTGSKKFSEINFSGTQSRAIVTTNNTLISDLSLNFDSHDFRSCSDLIITTYTNAIKLNNLDLSHISRVGGQSQGAIHIDNNSSAILSGTINLNGDGIYGNGIVVWNNSNLTIVEDAEVNIKTVGASNNSAFDVIANSTVDIYGKVAMEGRIWLEYGQYSGNSVTIHNGAEITTDKQSWSIQARKDATTYNSITIEEGAKIDWQNNNSSFISQGYIFENNTTSSKYISASILHDSGDFTEVPCDIDWSTWRAIPERGDVEEPNRVVYDKEQFDTTLTSFDEMISDSSYQGVNLIKGGKLTTMFNEDRTHSYTINGKDMSSNNIGIVTREWVTKDDIAQSIKEIQNAMISIRDEVSRLGNSLSVIETRMNFTDAMCDVLQTGADDLVLADMNEESANYLALQTRNNLAVNALALAAQSNNAVLKLF